MEENNKHRSQTETMRRIRNNIRKGNFRKVSELIKTVLMEDDSNEEKHDLMEDIYKSVIEPWVKGTNNNEQIPRQYEEMLLKYASYTQNQGDLERTIDVLETIKESKNPRIRKKVSRQIKLIDLSQELSKGDDIDIDAIESITHDIENDIDSSTYMELISSIFGKEFSIDKLSLGELEKYTAGKHRKPSDVDVDPVKGTYPKELQAENRMKFFREEIGIAPNIRFCDKGIFAGSILLEIKDTDWILVEKVINIYADGTFEPNNYGSATYILPKDKVLDLIKLQTREKVKTQLKSNEIKGIDPIQHREKWKNNIKDAIEQIKNVSEVQIDDTPEQEPIEDVETVESTQAVPPRKFNSKNRHINNIIANREFLQDINFSLDGILTNEMIEQLIKRTSSYSFESIYNNRLKQKIFESLELLDMPKEQMETEAKKIFLVMKMTREDMSRMKSKEGSKGGISEEDLSYLTEQYSCYYDDALDVLKTCIEQGMDYEQTTDAMKKCILIQDIEKEKQPKKTSTKASNKIEKQFEHTTEKQEENDKMQEKTTKDESLSQNEQTKRGIERLLEDMSQNSNGNPMIMGIAQKMQELLTRITELDEKLLKANEELEKILKEEEKAKRESTDRSVAQIVAKERLEEAIKAEKEASDLAKQAIKAEAEASKRKSASEERQKNLVKEKEELEKKLKEFLEL